MTVGLCHNPSIAGKGGRGLGIPRCPSIDARIAVSSPHTKAPAPCFIEISNENPLFNIFSPKNPFSLACEIAMPNLLSANGYSARQ